ncbi:NucA/NucB deoxyribonuclease domain-containing protein [Kribbella sp. NPDC051587]|uniref:NucA/NucB deoxyribonuclease domain-containing protein n=1 Tax=Kribbella sp. NPDC051587 TaxID=3364119 RepID=UPI00379903C8
MRYRPLAIVGLLVASAIIIPAAQSAAKSPTPNTPDRPPLPPAGVAIPVAKPRPLAPMKALPRSATVKDYQRAVAKYAEQSGQSYAVDSSSFATNKRYARAAAGEPDVPGSFSYLTVPECRDRGDTMIPVEQGGTGRIYNHWQWCGWQSRYTKHEIKTTYFGPFTEVGALLNRQTVMGWGSQSTTEVTVRVYVDQINSPAGSDITAANSTLTAIPSCTDVFGNGSCSFSQPQYSMPFIDLQAGNIIEFKAMVTLPPETPENPDRVTGMNLNVRFAVTSSATPGWAPTSGSYTASIRCDQSKSGEFQNKPGCIFNGVIPYYSLKIGDPAVGQVAEHIHQALTDPDSTSPQTSGPKMIPWEIHRETDSARQRANRDKATDACNRVYGEERPEGKQCDEYPFAASEEGAAARDGDAHYSVALIDKSHNETEGGQRSAWLKADRIIDGDLFRVVAN